MSEKKYVLLDDAKLLIARNEQFDEPAEKLLRALDSLVVDVPEGFVPIEERDYYISESVQAKQRLKEAYDEIADVRNRLLAESSKFALLESKLKKKGINIDA